MIAALLRDGNCNMGTCFAVLLCGAEQAAYGKSWPLCQLWHVQDEAWYRLNSVGVITLVACLIYVDHLAWPLVDGALLLVPK
jgi:hypothetical protein